MWLPVLSTVIIQAVVLYGSVNTSLAISQADGSGAGLFWGPPSGTHLYWCISVPVPWCHSNDNQCNLYGIFQCYWHKHTNNPLQSWFNILWYSMGDWILSWSSIWTYVLSLFFWCWVFGFSIIGCPFHFFCGGQTKIRKFRCVQGKTQPWLVGHTPWN